MKKNLFAALAIALLVASAGSQAADSITLQIGSGSSNIGDDVEIQVSMVSGDTSPATIIFFITYDAAKLQPFTEFYEFVAMGLEGPLTDSEGNVITTTSAVRLDPQVADAGKVVDVEIHEGALAISITGLNMTPIPDGPLVTVALRILGGAQENETLYLSGGPYFLNDEWLESSAADVNAQDVPVVSSGGRIELGCTPPPAPSNVVATQDRPDAVLVTWEGIGVSGAEYRVYRSQDTSAATALPIGEGWQAATSFEDITAAVPVVNSSAGCCWDANVSVVRYYYWVKARNPIGCESAFNSTPAEGFRSASKAAALSGKTAADVFPADSMGGGRQTGQSDSQLAVRITAADPIDPATVWGVVAGGDFDDTCVRWAPAGGDEARTGWVVYDPVVPWREGDVITLSVGAYTMSGTAIGPIVRQIEIEAESGMFPKAGAPVQITERDASGIPYLPEGVGAVYAIGPEGVFQAPQQVRLPVPVGVAPGRLILYYYAGAQGDRRWYTATQVEGWLAGGVEVVQYRGAAYLCARVRHSATVQLGFPPETDAPLPEGALADAEAAGFGFPGRGDTLLFALISIVLLVGGRRVSRRSEGP